MKVKPKKCKGINSKTKGYGCGKESYWRVYGLGQECGCYQVWLINTEEGKKKLDRMTLKATEPRRSLEKATKEKKERIGIQTSLKTTETKVHEMIRLRDQYKPCISCGSQWDESFDAGHYFAVNNHRSLRFDFKNIHGQCRQCNRMNDGNFTNYSLMIPNRISIKEFKKLNQRALNDKKEVKKWNKEELKEIRNEATKIIKQLK